MNKTPSKPWYLEPWPWLLMAGPAVVIVAGAVTIWLAVSGADGLVEDDYYKQGLAVNQRKQRDAEAFAQGMSARVWLGSDGRAVEIELTTTQTKPKPPVLNLHLAHPTRSGQDIDLALPLDRDGRYRGAFVAAPNGRWYVSLDDPTMRWRLLGEWGIARGSEVSLNSKSDDSSTGGQNHGMGTVVQK